MFVTPLTSRIGILKERLRDHLPGEISFCAFTWEDVRKRSYVSMGVESISEVGNVFSRCIEDLCRLERSKTFLVQVELVDPKRIPLLFFKQVNVAKIHDSY